MGKDKEWMRMMGRRDAELEKEVMDVGQDLNMKMTFVGVDKEIGGEEKEDG